jgi:hypothetical protein
LTFFCERPAALSGDPPEATGRGGVREYRRQRTARTSDSVSGD